MTSLTRTPACTVKGCPAPRDPDWHVPWCQVIPDHECFGGATHQHWPKRSQGGKEIVACLCAGAHDRIDNKDWGNGVKEFPGRGRVYFAWDLHGNTLIERDINGQESPRPAASPEEGSGDAEGVAGTQQASETPEEEKGQVLSAAAESERSRAQAGSEVSATMGVAFDSSVPPVSTKGSAAAPSAGVLSDGAEAEKPGSITINFDRGGEGDAGPASSRGLEGTIKPDSVAAHTSAPSPSTKEESDGDELGTVRRGAADMGVSPGQPTEEGRPTVLDGVRADDGRSDTLSLLTHEQRVAVAKQIKDTEWNRQWFAGDTGNLWIEQLGESAEQYLSDFGYVHESLANILRVCAAIPPAYRNGNLRFSHHVVVYDENLEDMEMHLAECEEKQWSVAEFRRQRKGTKPLVKRWSREELVAEVGQFLTGRDVYTEALDSFLDWLKEQA